MKITNLLSNLILEQSRYQVLYDKLVKPTKEKKGLIDFDTFKKIIFADPDTKYPQGFDKETATEKDMENVKVGKYVQWILRNYISPKKSDLGIPENADMNNTNEYKRALENYQNLYLEDLYKVENDLKSYERFKSYLPLEQRQIDKLTPRSLSDIINNFKLPEKKKSELEKKEIKKTRSGYNHAGGEIIHQGPKWTVVRISDKGDLGKEAANWYGGFDLYNGVGNDCGVNCNESHWCTSSPGIRSHFDRYIKDGPLYVILPNNDNGEVGKKTGLPKERYQFHFESDQFMNRDDRQINLKEMMEGEMSELKELFKKNFFNKLIIPDSKAFKLIVEGKSKDLFISLYGFDDIFELLPEDLEQIYIKNNSSDNISLVVPESIGRFKKMKNLFLENIVKSLPDTIGELKSLVILTLSKNRDLLSIPESVADLPRLTFLNLENSNPNIKVPKKLKDKFQEGEENFHFVG